MITDSTQIATLFHTFKNYRIRFSKDVRNNRLLLFIDVKSNELTSTEEEHLTILIPYDCKNNKDQLYIKDYYDFQVEEIKQFGQQVKVMVTFKVLNFGEYIGTVGASFQVSKLGVYNAVGKSHTYDSFMNLIKENRGVQKQLVSMFRLSA